MRRGGDRIECLVRSKGERGGADGLDSEDIERAIHSLVDHHRPADDEPGTSASK